MSSMLYVVEDGTRSSTPLVVDCFLSVRKLRVSPSFSSFSTVVNRLVVRLLVRITGDGDIVKEDECIKSVHISLLLSDMGASNLHVPTL